MTLEDKKELLIKEWRLTYTLWAKTLLAKIQNPSVTKERRKFFVTKLKELKPQFELLKDVINNI